MHTTCTNCIHRYNREGCRLDFRFAAGAAGQAVDCTQDVYRCKDLYEENDDAVNDDND